MDLEKELPQTRGETGYIYASPQCMKTDMKEIDLSELERKVLNQSFETLQNP